MRPYTSRLVSLLSGFLFTTVLLGFTGLRAPDQSASDSLTDEEREILRHFGLVQQSDGLGGTVTTLRLSSANLQVVNGLGVTESQNGLGNVIVGYSALGYSWGRSGSHVLVAGDGHSWMSNMSETVAGAGLLVGEGSRILGPYGSISGGFFNEAWARASIVAGGESNRAGSGGSVGGGSSNIAGDYASVSGGENGSASGRCSSIAGGGHYDPDIPNRAVAEHSFVAGGALSKGLGPASVVLCGAWLSDAIGRGSTVLGGAYVDASAPLAVVLAGNASTASGLASMVLGTHYDAAAIASGPLALIAGSRTSQAEAEAATILGGEGQHATGVGATLLMGRATTCSGAQAASLGGDGNQVAGERASTSGGRACSAVGEASSVSGGSARSADGADDWVAGGLHEED